jgi:hypothetical protein
MEKKPCYWGEAPPPKKRGVSEKPKGASSSKKKVEDTEGSGSESESDRTVGKGKARSGSGEGARHLAALVSEMRRVRESEEERNRSLKDLSAGLRSLNSTLWTIGIRVEGALQDLRSDIQEMAGFYQEDEVDRGFVPDFLGEEDSVEEEEDVGDEEIASLGDEEQEARGRAAAAYAVEMAAEIAAEKVAEKEAEEKAEEEKEEIEVGAGMEVEVLAEAAGAAPQL